MHGARRSLKLHGTMTISSRNLAIALATLIAICLGTVSDAQQRNRGDAPAAYFARPSERAPGRDDGESRGLSLNDAVSMVQERFNATAVKTDTVMESGQLTYRIRLLSADKSRVWTVSVDARSGRVY